MIQNQTLLSIDWKAYNAGELRTLCETKLKDTSADWEHSFYNFIKEWISDVPVIKAFTSGTTGAQKDILLLKENMLLSASMTLDHLQITPNSSALLCLSCQHIAGKMMVVRAFAGKLNLIPAEPSANPLRSIPDKNIDFAAFVPLQIDAILKDNKTTHALQKINNVIIGGAPFAPQLAEKVKGFANNIYETFGMTETISHIALKKVSTSGTNNLFSTLKGITVSTDERQCLLIHAPHLSDSPIVTNDIVRLIDSRRFEWLGRLDNVVNSGGIKLSPELLEQKISGLFNRNYFFMGKPDHKLGQKLILAIEGEPFDEAEMSQLKTALRNALGPYESPKEIIFVPEFSKTSSGKLIRKID